MLLLPLSGRERFAFVANSSSSWWVMMMIWWWWLLLLLSSSSGVDAASLFDYKIVEIGGLSITDQATDISDVKTLFTDEIHVVSLTGLVWEKIDTTAVVTTTTTTNTTTIRSDSLAISYETYLDRELVDSGVVNLTDIGRTLPTTIQLGTFTPTKTGRTTVRVVLATAGDNQEPPSEEEVEEEERVETEGSFLSMRSGVSIIPLLLLIGLAVSTAMIEISLLSGIFVGACMIAGNINDGFKTTFDTFILDAVINEGHGFVYLFTLFLAGLVGMMEKSGGMMGFVQSISGYATTSRAGQLITFGIGLLIFFDDYANTLLAGETMRPLTDTLYISREKLSYIVDATAAPIASMTPISSWVGFEVNLIQTEIDRLIEQFGVENLTIQTTGMGVFLQSIKYRYYPIFIVLIMFFTILTKRDYGTMLIAERKTQVYKRTDGGDSAVTKKASVEDIGNKPRPGTPFLWWNLILPMGVLVFLIFWLLIKSGEDKSVEQTLLDKLQESDSYSALLWGTIGTTFLTMLLYFVQIVQNGRLVCPTPVVILSLFKKTSENNNEEGTEESPRLLMSLDECVQSFVHGMTRIFPALIILTLAWAVGDIMTSVGVDRLVSRWITGGLDPSLLPTLSFIISAIVALATGTSWGTMSIMFPLLMRATYVSSNGDTDIFYSTVAGILSGAVAGDHASPISDTTVLAALASECKLMAHVGTQMPYAIVASIVAILFGTLPFGRGAWPNIVGILLGAGALLSFVFLVCKPVINSNGSYDIITELYMRVKQDKDLLLLKADTIAAYQEQLHPTTAAPAGATTTMGKMEDGNSNEEVPSKVVMISKGNEVEKPIVAEPDELMA